MDRLLLTKQALANLSQVYQKGVQISFVIWQVREKRA